MRFALPALPPSWKATRLDHVASVNARIGWKALTASEYVDDGYVFLSTPNIKGRDIDFEVVNYIDEFRYEESPDLMLQVGDVLLAKDGSTLGITNVVLRLPRPATVNGSIAVLRPRRMESRYLRYALASDLVQGMIGSVKAGMGVPHLFQADIKKLPLPEPPGPVQRAIADYLDAETARIDALIVKKRRLIELLDEADRSTVDAMFGGGFSGPTVRLARLARLQTGLTLDSAREAGSGSVTLPYLRVANVGSPDGDVGQAAA